MTPIYPIYNPANWYWSGTPVGHGAIIYSSAAAAVVASNDATYLAWLAMGNAPTPWPQDNTNTGTITTGALDTVLTAAGLPATGL